MAKSFRELLVWQKGVRLSVLIYRLSRRFPREEAYGLSLQMRKAAVSIPSNIAEGAGRLNRQEFRQFLGIARGSSFELQTPLTIAKELELGDREQLQEAEVLCDEVGRMLFGVIQSVDTEPDRKTKSHSHTHTRAQETNSHSHSHSHLHTHTSTLTLAFRRPVHTHTSTLTLGFRS